MSAHGDVGMYATFHALGINRDAPSFIIVLKSEKEDAGYLRVNPTTHALETGGDGKGKEYEFQLVPLRNQAYGCQLCSELTGKLISVSEDLEVSMVDAGTSDETATAFILRYNPQFDTSWQNDPQYSGKRSWIRDSTNELWTFKEFVDFVIENKMRNAQGAHGIPLAKVKNRISKFQNFNFKIKN